MNPYEQLTRLGYLLDELYGWAYEDEVESPPPDPAYPQVSDEEIARIDREDYEDLLRGLDEDERHVVRRSVNKGVPIELWARYSYFKDSALRISNAVSALGLANPAEENEKPSRRAGIFDIHIAPHADLGMVMYGDRLPPPQHYRPNHVMEPRADITEKDLLDDLMREALQHSISTCKAWIAALTPSFNLLAESLALPEYQVESLYQDVVDNSAPLILFQSELWRVERPRKLFGPTGEPVDLSPNQVRLMQCFPSKQVDENRLQLAIWRSGQPRKPETLLRAIARLRQRIAFVGLEITSSDHIYTMKKIEG